MRLGFAFREQNQRDFGIDAHSELIDESGQATGRLLGMQVKTGSSYFWEQSEDGFIFRTDREHVEYWLSHSLPVLICLCDVDTNVVYWQAVNTETAVSTGKRYKFNVPRSQKVDYLSAPVFHDILTPITSPSRYTIFREEDQSHGAAKRYSCKAVLNGTLSKVEIAAVVRQLTNNIAKRRYHSNHFVEARWGDSDAHVVWTFIYPSAEDYARQNFICRSLWISDSLPENFRPSELKGENVGDNIIAEWHSNYFPLKELGASFVVTKVEYFSRIIPLVRKLESLLTMMETRLLSLSRNELREEAFLQDSENTRSRIRGIYDEIGNLPDAPFECKDVDHKLLEVAACSDNIVTLFSVKGMQTWNKRSRLQQSLEYVSDSRRALEHLKYEMEKIR